jgi:hypothetical protein
LKDKIKRGAGFGLLFIATAADEYEYRTEPDKLF